MRILTYLSFMLLGFAAGADQVQSLHEAFAGHRVLALGETGHEQPAIDDFALKLVRELGTDIDWIGLEAPSSEQEAIDRRVAGDSSAPVYPKLAPLLDLVAELNRGRPTPLRVIPLDLTSQGESQEGGWFARRDGHMLETLRAQTNGFAGRGLLHMGMAHLSAAPFRLPRLMSHFLGVSPELHTFGERLESEPELRGRILRVAVHADVPWIEKWGLITPDFRPFYRAMNRGPAFGPASAIPNDARFPVSVGEGFDYFVKLPVRIGARAQCAAVLNGKMTLVRGVLFRAADLWARLRQSR